MIFSKDDDRFFLDLCVYGVLEGLNNVKFFIEPFSLTTGTNDLTVVESYSSVAVSKSLVTSLSKTSI